MSGEKINNKYDRRSRDLFCTIPAFLWAHLILSCAPRVTNGQPQNGEDFACTMYQNLLCSGGSTVLSSTRQSNCQEDDFILSSVDWSSQSLEFFGDNMYLYENPNCEDLLAVVDAASWDNTCFGLLVNGTTFYLTCTSELSDGVPGDGAVGDGNDGATVDGTDDSSTLKGWEIAVMVVGIVIGAFCIMICVGCFIVVVLVVVGSSGSIAAAGGSIVATGGTVILYPLAAIYSCLKFIATTIGERLGININDPGRRGGYGADGGDGDAGGGGAEESSGNAPEREADYLTSGEETWETVSADTSSSMGESLNHPVDLHHRL